MKYILVGLALALCAACTPQADGEPKDPNPESTTTYTVAPWYTSDPVSELRPNQQ